MKAPNQQGPASEFGLRVAAILDAIFAIYNVHGRLVLSDERRAEWLCSGDLSTFDGDVLTQLVVRCHDACIRISIEACTPRYVRVVFHRRTGREGSLYERHPSIEDAIVRVRARNYYGETKPVEVTR